MEEAKTTTLIKVECTDQVLRLTQTPTIASGGVKEDTVEFAFDNLWDGFNLAAVFYCGEKEVYHVGIVDNRCIVPREVLANPGYFYLGVMGVKDGVTRTTNVLSYRVEAGAITDGVKPPEPTPSIYEQILASVKYAEQIAQSVRDDADAGKFDGAKGDPGADGAPGKDGKDGSDATVTAENIQSALGYAPGKTLTSENYNGQIENLFPDKITFIVNNFWRYGNVCTFVLQINVPETMAISYGANIAKLPFTSPMRCWLNNSTDYFIDNNTQFISRNGVNISSGNYVLSGMYITNDMATDA